MRRDYSVIKDPEVSVPGDQAAHSAAMALANRFDAQTLEAIHDMFTALDRFGGQAFVAVRRAKYDSQGEIPKAEERETPGQWLTTGFAYGYEQRDIALTEIKPIPDEVELHELDRKAPDSSLVVALEEEEAELDPDLDVSETEQLQNKRDDAGVTV